MNRKEAEKTAREFFENVRQLRTGYLLDYVVVELMSHGKPDTAWTRVVKCIRYRMRWFGGFCKIGFQMPFRSPLWFRCHRPYKSYRSIVSKQASNRIAIRMENGRPTPVLMPMIEKEV